MALSDDQIHESIQRYERERDRFKKMAEVVYERCQSIVHKKLTIRATVHRRVKGVDSLREKLKKQRVRERYDSVDEAFSGLSDLAAVRIMTYLESDRGAIVDAIRDEFLGKDAADLPEIDEKDADGTKQHYRATHCQVYLTESDLEPPNDNLHGTTCEIQICSLLAHVFNEIEHDLRYKPTTGDLSEEEDDHLDQLGLLTRAGDTTIRLLLGKTEHRLQERTGSFEDVYDFVARMRSMFNMGPEFSKNAGQLYDELVALGVNSPEEILRICEYGEDDMSTEGRRQIKGLQEFAQQQGYDILEIESSDIALMAVLPNLHDRILQNHPMGRGQGRPPRIAQIARLYRMWRDQE